MNRYILPLLTIPSMGVFLLLSVASTWAADSVTGKSSHSNRPNVILVLTDDQGYGDLACHGNPRLKTPNIDKLYRQSIRFTDFHVAPICTPSRSQLLSGRDALANGAMNASSGRAIMRQGLPTMANFFATSGYRTAIFGKWHVGHTWPYRPQDRGFEEVVWFPMSQISSVPDAWNNDYYDDRYWHGDQLQSYDGYCTDVFFREAIDWIRAQRDRGEPFFAYLPLNAAHFPYFAQDKDRAPYQDLSGDLPNFFGMIANIDENMGRLETMLCETGLRDNTLLIFMSDNGTAVSSKFYNAGMRGHKFQLWEGGHRVPCFVRWPNGGLRPPCDVAELTQCQDLLPTLLELCDLSMSKETLMDGVSLAPLLRGESGTLEDRMLVIQYSRSNTRPDRNVSRPPKGNAAVLWKRWRLLDQKKLYDLKTDPGQQRNVAPQFPEVVAKMRAHYDSWWNRIVGRLDSFEPIYIGDPKHPNTVLTPGEWADVWLDQADQVRRGVPKNGVWHLHAVTAGQYKLSLRRWPPSVHVPLHEGVPEHVGEVGYFEAGVALPIAMARIRIGQHDEPKRTGQQNESVDFTIELPAGSNQLQTWFYDKNNQPISGAYYVVVSRNHPTE